MGGLRLKYSSTAQQYTLEIPSKQKSQSGIIILQLAPGIPINTHAYQRTQEVTSRNEFVLNELIKFNSLFWPILLALKRVSPSLARLRLWHSGACSLWRFNGLLTGFFLSVVCGCVCAAAAPATTAQIAVRVPIEVASSRALHIY